MSEDKIEEIAREDGASDSGSSEGEIRAIPDSSDDILDNNEWSEIDKDGYENILGSGRLRRKILVEAPEKEGKERPIKGDYVKVKIKGYFEDHSQEPPTRQMFEELDDFEFFLQEAEVIQAIDLVVALMYVGETDEVIADPEFAYGSAGYPPILPPGAAAVFEVSLLDHHGDPAFPTDIELEERMKIGQRKKGRGNVFYARGEYSLAVQCYRRAAEYFDDEKIELEVPMDRYYLPQELQDLVEEKVKVLNNLAQAQMKLEAWESALASLKQVLKLEPNNEKALFRKAMALQALGKYEESAGVLRRQTRLFPNNKTAQIELNKLLDKLKSQRRKEETLSKKMLGLDKYEAEAKAKKAGWGRVSKTLFMTFVMGGMGAILGGVVAYLKAQSS